MTVPKNDSPDTEALHYLCTPDLDPLFWPAGRTSVASAWYGHVPFAHWIVSTVKPHTLVELGTQNGVSYSAFCDAVIRNRFDTRCYAVDTWKGDDQAGYYGEEIYLDFRRFHDDRYATFSELLRCTFDEALAYMPDTSVDLLHIDGLHTYEAVRHDFEGWRSKLSESAVVLFHDTNVREGDFGVWRFWQELRTQFPGFEFLHGHGLGVLAVGRSAPTQISSLCSLRDPTCVLAIRERFSRLGERWIADRCEQLRKGEVAARDARILSLEEEIAARDARILSLEGEIAARGARIVSLEGEVAARDARRARAAQRTAEARTEAANAMMRVAAAKSQAIEAPLVAKAADIATEQLNRLRFARNLARELADFLASKRRLSFRAERAPDVSVIVVLFNQAHFTLSCLRAVLAQVGTRVEVILVDNHSTDRTPQLLERLDNVRVLRNRHNTGFLLAVNQAAAEARGRSILFLNSDAFMRKDALPIALQTLESDDQIGAVGGKLVLPSGRLQEAGSIIWSDASTQGYARNLPSQAGEAMFRRDVDYCSAAFLLTRRVLFERMGRFDTVYAPAYYEDADYCARLWQSKLRVVYEPRAVVDHYEFGSETRGAESLALSMRNRKHLRSRHAGTLQLQHFPPSAGNMLLARDHFRARRRLLVIDNEVPLIALGSGYPRMRAILNEAVADGWFVTFYPLHLPHVNWEVVYSELSPEIEISDGRGKPGLAGFLAERPSYYDAILVSRPTNMALFNDAVRDRPHVIAGSRLLYDAEAMFAVRDIMRAELEQRPISTSNANKMIMQEVKLTASVDSVITVSANEAQVFRERQVAPVYVLSHPTLATWDVPGFEGRAGFLFVGRLLEEDAPNYQGLTWFLRSVWPDIRAALSEVTLTVVGAMHPKLRELAIPGVQLLGQVEDLRPLYNSARVFIAPIRFAAGIPIKILEATAAGLPVVGTKLMATQLGWRPGVEIEAIDDPTQMAMAAIALHDDEPTWQGVRTAALQRLSREHSEAGFRRGLRAILGGDEPSSTARATEPDDAVEAHRVARVNTVWSAAEAPNGHGEPWMAHPMVRACVNRRASGDRAYDPYARLMQLLTEMGWEMPVECAVSLCCGGGELERGLAGLGIARRIIGYDLAETAICKARAEAAAAGLSNLEYEVRDLEREGLGLEHSKVDLIFAHSAVHHISRLEALFDAVHAALRPGGIFHLNEYVGPDRFQWTERQLAEINDFLGNLPERYRRLPGGELRSSIRRPTIEEMLRHDPSEAVRSSQIEPLASERFHIVERRALGGTLLHMALSDIAQNFDPAKEEDQIHVQRLIDREEQLMTDHSIGSDFIVLVAQRKE